MAAAARGLAVPGRAEMLFFYLHPLGLGFFQARLPDLMSSASLDKGGLAQAMLGMPLGTFIIFLVSGQLLRRMGHRNAWLAGHVLTYLSMPLLGFMPDGNALFAAFALLGAGLLWAQICMNVQGNRVETEEGVYVMSRCHGCFMIGLGSGTVLGAATKIAGLPFAWALAGISLANLAFGCWVIMRAREYPPAPAPARRRFAVPGAGFIPVAIFLLGIALAEGVTLTWAVVYLNETLARPSDYAGFILTVFTGCFALMRLVGDRWKERFGAIRTARCSIAVALAGLLLIVWAPHAAALVLGYALLGAGISLGIPYAMSTMAKLGDSDSAVNAAWLMTLAIFAFQFAGIIAGYVAAASSLRASFALLLPLLLGSLLTAGRLANR